MDIKSYRTVGRESKTEYVVSRSKFIAHAYPAGSAGEAEEKLAALKAAHPFASHICYAYSVYGRGGAGGRRGAGDGCQAGCRGGGVLDDFVINRAVPPTAPTAVPLQKSSDAGEPKGTAGQPIAEAIKNNGLDCALVAVVRYFGGVKLGTGGLARAYARAAADAVKSAGVAEYRLMAILELTLDFSAAAKIRNLKNGIEIKREFSDKVVLTLASPDPEKLKEEIDGILQRKGEYRPVGKEYFAAPPMIK
jgi:putative IMPACT (imprinted ancient) family translation regulator